MKRKHLLAFGMIVAIFSMALIPKETQAKVDVHAVYTVDVASVTAPSFDLGNGDAIVVPIFSLSYIAVFSEDLPQQWGDTLVLGKVIKVTVDVFRPPELRSEKNKSEEPVY